MRDTYAIIQRQYSHSRFHQYPPMKLLGYMIDTAMDTDADQFSIDILPPDNDNTMLLHRDTEVRVSIYTGLKKGVEVLHTGLADRVTFDTDDRHISISGRDYSSVATDTTAPPMKWKHVQPASFIASRASKLGINNVHAHQVSEIGTLTTDGSETEWGLWYRIARTKDMFLWFEPTGRLVMDRLNNDSKADYFFGTPGKSTPQSANWIGVERVEVTKDDQGRLGEVRVYAGDPKKNTVYHGFGVDTSIPAWRRRPVKVMTSTTAKSSADAQKIADNEIFESIVGATEIMVTIRDPGFVVKQNSMARVDLPDIGLSGTWYIVGTRLRGGADGFFQDIRLRDRSFALSKRVPDAPNIDTSLSPDDPTLDPTLKPSGQIGANITHIGGTQQGRYGRIFWRAAEKYAGGWDIGLFAAVLMSIGWEESKFQNVRGGGHIEWYPRPESLGIRADGVPPVATQDLVEEWRRLFANHRGNPLNPRGGDSNTAVGIMQLVTDQYVDWADQNGNPFGTPAFGEYDGGRWNPESNIMAGARAFKQKLDTPSTGARPDEPDSIWNGVKAYYGSHDDAANEYYKNQVKHWYLLYFRDTITGAIQQATPISPSPTGRSIEVPGHGTIDTTGAPESIIKAVAFALVHLGDPYLHGGPTGQGSPTAKGHLLYDCSSLVAASLYAGGVREIDGDPLDPPTLGNHGTWSTYKFYAHGESIARDKLRIGDAVFFNNVEHMGMYLGRNQFIQDPHTGDVVKISTLGGGYSDGYVGARRVVPWGGRGATSGD
jgi:cell wall-associated NlpC family hydrolase/prophage tail gpP-like protein